MIETLKRFFEDYPRQFLQPRNISATDLPDGLMERLLDYRHRQLVNLEDSQHFRVEQDAFWMMSELINEMTSSGLEELFSQVRLPFPTMIIQVPVEGGGDDVPLGVVTQVDDAIYTQRLVVRSGQIASNISVMIRKGTYGASVSTPTHELLVAIGQPIPAEMFDEERTSNRTFLGVAVAISILLSHDGMLKIEDVSLYPRQMRRQAERAGKVLPDTLISKITLGKAGRGQVEAMRDDPAADEPSGVPRRAHWVRGHTMRSRAGQIVWRMPHLRGAGPVIKQVRQIVGPSPVGIAIPNSADSVE